LVVAPSGSVVAADWQALADLFEKWVAGGESDLYRRALDHFDRLIISRILADCGGSQTEASERLGLSRVTLRTKLRAAHLAVGKVLSRQGSSQASGAEQIPD
jgi:DNA-binding protein Fis